MTTHFITAEVDLKAASDLQNDIQAQLQEQGESLRWAVTDVSNETAHVEAVVLAD